MAEQVPESDTVYDLLNLAPDSKYLPKAIEIVNGPRKASYGPPELCMKRSVDAMNNLLDAALSPPDLALAMICVKMARQFNSHDPDNYVDICGYALLYKQVKEYWNDPEPTAEELLVQELCAIEHELSAMKEDYKALCDTLNDKENELIRLRAQVRRLTSCAE